MQIANEDGKQEARCLIRQQNYLELLEEGKTTEALFVLRNQLASLHPDPSQLHPLSTSVYLLIHSDIKLIDMQFTNVHRCIGLTTASFLGWRQRVITAETFNRFTRYVCSSELLLLAITPATAWIPSSVMIPPRRFPVLLEQALQYQRSQCLWHNAPPRSMSLYSDHLCEEDVFPRHNTFNLVSHEDEVWNLEWSHSGQRLATASKDKSVIIWSVEVCAPALYIPKTLEQLTFAERPGSDDTA
jgi:WD repeat-containing protein 26